MSNSLNMCLERAQHALFYNEISIMRCEKIEDESIPLVLKFRLKDDHFWPFHRTTYAVFVAA